MKILALNGSPRGAEGNTEILLRAFLQGAQSRGADAETVYLKEKEIKHCRGCYTCWGKTPGVCVHKDDMAELLEKRRWADTIVYATPLYVYTVSGLMKDFMDRGIPLVLPHIKKYGDTYAHPRRYDDQPGTKKKMVLISNAGFPDRKIFSGLIEVFNILGNSPHTDMAGMILCSAGPLLRIAPLEVHIRWYLEACEKAGQELVEQGRISDDTQAVLDRDLITDTDNYMAKINQMWDQTLAGINK